jgi:hypothetical protein
MDMTTKKKRLEELWHHRTTKPDAPFFVAMGQHSRMLVSHEGEYPSIAGSMQCNPNKKDDDARLERRRLFLLCWLHFASIATFYGIAHLVYHLLCSLLDFARGLIDFALLLQSLVIGHYAH